MALYDKPVRQLMRDMVDRLTLRPGQVIDREVILDWFRSNYPLVTEGTVAGHLVRMSINVRARLHHNIKTDGSDDLFFKIDSRRFRLYDPQVDPAPIKADMPAETGDDPDLSSADDSGDSSRFAYEHDLRDYLAKNLHLIESGLTLYSDEGITDIEFDAGGRYIDILAVDRAGAYVAIELKVSKGHDRAIGQLLRYMGWIEKHHAAPGQSVRGTANKATEFSDYSVCTTWGVKDKKFYLLDVYRRRLEFPELKKAVIAQRSRWNPNKVLIEDKASGTQLIQELKHEGVPNIEPYTPLAGMDKQMRLYAQSTAFESGNVLLPKYATWLPDYVRELTGFPGTKHDDQVDSTTQALQFLRKQRPSLYDML